MALNIPNSALTIFNRISSDIVNEINELDPYLRNSLLRSIAVADSNAFFEAYKTLQQVEKMAFIDTAEGTYLERWGAIYGITRNPSSIASGFVTFTGTDLSAVSAGSELSSEDGNVYEVVADGVVALNNLSITSLTRSAGIVTATTSIDHGLASNISVIISGAAETDYNGTFTITVTGLNTFTYTIETTPTTPATGTIFASSTYVNLQVNSTGFGASQNLISGSPLSLSSPISGVDTTAYVSFDEISGGTDVESDDDLRDRVLFRTQNPIALFNENAIIDQARLVPGVTRVWVQDVDNLNLSKSGVSITRSGDIATVDFGSAHGFFDGQIIAITGADQVEYNVVDKKIIILDSNTFAYQVSGTPATPATGTIAVNYAAASIGQVRIFFTRDNDDDPIPSSLETETVREKIVEIKPATTPGSDVLVNAPTPVTVDYTFTELTPNTESMQTAITNNLIAYHASGTELAKDLKEVDYQSIINNTLDSGGNVVESFTLSAPTGTISIGVSDLPVLGTITYP